MDAKDLHSALTFVTGGACDIYVVSRDFIKNVHYIDRTLIMACNSDTQENKGAHWCVFYVYKKGQEIVCDFYDSFGLTSSEYSITPPYRVVNINRERHQSANTSFCGHLVIYFISLRIRYQFGKAISRFNKHNTAKNEAVALKFYERVVMRAPTEKNVLCARFGCVPLKFFDTD